MTKDRIEQILNSVSDAARAVALAEAALGSAVNSGDYVFAATVLSYAEENRTRVFHEAVAELVAALPLAPGEEAPMQAEKENTDVPK